MERSKGREIPRDALTRRRDWERWGGVSLSLSLWLAYLIQRNVLGSIQVIANKWLDFLLKAE